MHAKVMIIAICNSEIQDINIYRKSTGEKIQGKQRKKHQQTENRHWNREGTEKEPGARPGSMEG